MLMKDKTIRNIRLCCYIALLFCVVWTGFTFKHIVDLLGYGSSSFPIDWSVGSLLKIVIAICYLLGSFSMIALSTMAILNTFKGIRENTVFPRNNVKLLFWMALASFVHIIGYCNLQVLWEDDVFFQLPPTIFVMPFLLLFFAFMYKVAADAVEENNLTI